MTPLELRNIIVSKFEHRPPTTTADPEVRRVLVDLYENAITNNGHALNTDWLHKRGWIGFPLPEDNWDRWEPDEPSIWLAEALKTLGVKTLIAANLDLGPSAEDFSWIGEASLAGVVGFANELSIFLFLLTDPDVSFVVYCSKGEYHVVAGPQEFVEMAVGGSLEKAKANFIQHATESWGGADEPYLLDVLDEYEALLSAVGVPLSSPRAPRRTTTWYVRRQSKSNPNDVERIDFRRYFPLVSAQDSFDRRRNDPMTGVIPIRPENLKYSWFLGIEFDFDRYDYYLVSEEPGTSGVQ